MAVSEISCNPAKRTLPLPGSRDQSTERSSSEWGGVGWTYAAGEQWMRVIGHGRGRSY